MTHRIIDIKHRSAASSYSVHVGESVLDRAGQWAEECLGNQISKAAIISNPTVLGLYGDKVRRSLKRGGFDTSVWLMKDGERYKNMRSLESALKHCSDERLSRDDVIVALGGGVVGDLAGFAAAVYLRGIRFLQIPTTLLAMIDSSVGGKSGVNSEFGKNLIGAFHRPSGVLIDVDGLKTLPTRELTAGFCEAVKHGAISGRKLFDDTARYLADFPPVEGFRGGDRSVNLIARNVAFKASIVRQDETEETTRTDEKSRKILNFGHTFGHALEKVTNYRRFRHGEAVGYGMMLAAELSKNLDLLSQNELISLNDVVHRAGNLPGLGQISPESIIAALKFDKKSSAGNVNWVLLRGIGKPVIISENDIPRSALTRAVRTILNN